VNVPLIYSSTGPARCFVFRANANASCFRLQGSETKTGSVITEAGHHPPGYYAIVGAISRLSPRATGAIYLMRLATALITAFFITLAVRALARTPTPRVALAGLVVGLMPIVFAFGAVVNPSAPEIAAGIAVWACGLALVSNLRVGSRPDRSLVTSLGISASAFVLSRQSSMFWLGVIVIFLAWLAGIGRVRLLARSTAARIWTVVLLLCVAAQLSWIAFANGLDLSTPPGVDPHLAVTEIIRGTVGRSSELYVDMLGWPGWYDTRLPAITYVLLTAALGALVLFAVALGTRRYVAAMVTAIVLTVAVPIILESWQARHYGFYWQGRYTLPFAVGVPLLAAFALQSRRGERVIADSRFLPALGTVLVVAHVAGIYQASRRWSVGANGPVFFWLHPHWKAPIPQWLILIAFAGTLIALYAWLLTGLGTEGLRTSPLTVTTEEHRPSTVTTGATR
jgi:hypothetical protein